MSSFTCLGSIRDLFLLIISPAFENTLFSCQCSDLNRSRGSFMNELIAKNTFTPQI